MGITFRYAVGTEQISTGYTGALLTCQLRLMCGYESVEITCTSVVVLYN